MPDEIEQQSDNELRPYPMIKITDSNNYDFEKR